MFSPRAHQNIFFLKWRENWAGLNSFLIYKNAYVHILQVAFIFFSSPLGHTLPFFFLLFFFVTLFLFFNKFGWSFFFFLGVVICYFFVLIKHHSLTMVYEQIFSNSFFLSFHLFTSNQTKKRENKIFYILLLSIIPPFSIIQLFHSSNQTVLKCWMAILVEEYHRWTTRTPWTVCCGLIVEVGDVLLVWTV